jgi:dienelactone hydrolase
VPEGAGEGERTVEHGSGVDFHARGLNYWPDNEDLSNELTRLLGAAQDGGSTVSECLRTASRIDPSDEDHWYREWKQTADASQARGNDALRRGNVPTAQSNWLRAISYYQAALYPLAAADSRTKAALAGMRMCARRYLEHLAPAGEVVEIPWLDHHALQGYFVPAASCPGPAPVVICIGEPGSRKEEYLYKMARHARERGMAMLAVDLWGAGTGEGFEALAGRPELETAISHVMDYLEQREDVDTGRIAILGDGAGSSFVARGVAFDRRFAAAVCDGGIWDLQEQTFLANRIVALDSGLAAVNRRRSIARHIKCPVLVTLGEHGWLGRDRATLLFEQIKASHRDIQLKIFSGAETAAAQGHADNPTLANEYIFDWIAERLATDARDSLGLRRRAQA